MTLRPRLWRGPPLVLQILGLLLGGLIVAQLVTLVLTLVLPPAPSPQHSLSAVAAALRGDGAEERPDRLERVIQSGPPDLSGRGWVVSDRARGELARLLGARVADVRLAFYTPLPFAGTGAARKIAGLPDDGPMGSFGVWPQDERPALTRVLFQAPGGGPPPQLPPTAQIPGNARPPSRDTLPPGMGRDGSFPGGARAPGGFPGGPPPHSGGGTGQPLFRIDSNPPQDGRTGTWLPGDGGAAVPPLLQGPQARSPSSANPPPEIGAPPFQNGPGPNPQPRGGPLFDRGGLNPPPPVLLPRSSPPIEMRAAESATPPARAAPAAEPPPTVRAAPPEMPSIAPPPPPIAAPEPFQAPSDATGFDEPDREQGALPLPERGRGRGLFGLAPAPFVEGDFVAALRLVDGRWAIVQPAPEPFPNAWQRRVLLWFLIAFAIVAPLGWLFARRVVKPLTGFAAAAERLGRDPSASVDALDGPAEIGGAARAFNMMHSRLKSFVEDRTAMVGAISHDLRTPLTRLRFRIEDIDDDAVRDGMISEVEEMEEMIGSVLAFIRDASTAAARERLDLRTIVEDVVEGALFVGNDVRIVGAEPAPVEVDVLGIRRLLANLIDNAVKYGGGVRVRLLAAAGEARVAVIDQGPGIPQADLERAFEPFYRAADARASEKRGSGLGLAVCRSIARGHGGDVRLFRSPEGFTAELRVPLVDARDFIAA